MSDLTQDTWFGVPAPESEVPRHAGLKASDPNPAIAVYGTGPQAARCGTCALFVRHAHGRKTYGKCRQREMSHGAGTDHYATWSACSHYIPEEV